MSEVKVGISQYHHEGGTKEYFLVHVTANGTGRSFGAWGRIGARNKQVKYHQEALQSERQVQMQFDQAHAERVRKGYHDIEHTPAEFHANLEGFEQALAFVADLVGLGAPGQAEFKKNIAPIFGCSTEEVMGDLSSDIRDVARGWKSKSREERYGAPVSAAALERERKEREAREREEFAKLAKADEQARFDRGWGAW